MFGPLGPSLAPQIRASKTLTRILTPVANLLARASGHRQLGLKYDDLRTLSPFFPTAPSPSNWRVDVLISSSRRTRRRPKGDRSSLWSPSRKLRPDHLRACTHLLGSRKTLSLRTIRACMAYQARDATIHSTQELAEAPVDYTGRGTFRRTSIAFPW
jgi:hypothetical protein